MKELIKISSDRSNSHVGSAVSYAIAVHKVFASDPVLLVHKLRHRWLVDFNSTFTS